MLSHGGQFVALDVYFSECLLKFGDVLLDGHELHYLAGGFPNWRDRHVFVVEGAVLATINQRPAPNFAGKNRVPHLFVESPVLLSRFEHSRIDADDFFP